MPLKLFYAVICLQLGILRILADVSLPSYFSSNMVLQRDSYIRIWGSGVPKTMIWVEFLDHRPNVRVEKDGRWELKLRVGGAVKVGSALKIFENSTKAPPSIVLTNVIVGDVWIVGVSPGEGVSTNPGPRHPITGPARTLTGSDLNALVTMGGDPEPAWRLLGQGPISCLALAFAEELSMSEKGIPIGLVLADLKGLGGLDQNRANDAVDKALNKRKDDALVAANLRVGNRKKEEFDELVKLKRSGRVNDSPLLKDFAKRNVYLRKDFDFNKPPASVLSFKGVLW